MSLEEAKNINSSEVSPADELKELSLEFGCVVRDQLDLLNGEEVMDHSDIDGKPVFATSEVLKEKESRVVEKILPIIYKLSDKERVDECIKSIKEYIEKQINPDMDPLGSSFYGVDPRVELVQLVVDDIDEFLSDPNRFIDKTIQEVKNRPGSY